MTRQTQGILLAFLGTVLLRLAWSDTYLRYVTEWMKWPILASGAVLILLAIGPILHEPTKTTDGHEHSGVPRATWLLILPGLITFVISPPALGSYLADRRANESAASQPGTVAELSTTRPTAVAVEEFVWRAQSGGGSLVDRPVVLTGFVTFEGDDWFVTRLTIGCCAADALVFRVRVDGAPSDGLEVEQWVEVTGTYVAGSGASLQEDTVIEAADVTMIEEPRQTYE